MRASFRRLVCIGVVVGRKRGVERLRRLEGSGFGDRQLCSRCIGAGKIVLLLNLLVSFPCAIEGNKDMKDGETNLLSP